MNYTDNKKSRKRNLAILSFAAIIVILIIVLLYLSYGNNATANNNSQTEVIKVGVIGHFSGDYADYGLPMRNAISLYAEEFNQKNKDIQIQLIFEDDLTDSKRAASAMNKLINVDNVDYVISAQGSGATSVIAPIAEETKTILMVTLGSAPGILQGKDYVFRSVVSDVYQGSKIVEVMENRFDSKKVSGLYVNDAYGVGIKGYISKGNYDIGVQEMFEPQSTDFRTQLLKIKETNSDTLVIVARKAEFPIILKQIDELGLEFEHIITAETFKDESILESAGSTSEGIYTVFAKTPVDYVGFNSKYKETFGDDIGYSIYAYDGTVALLEAIKLSNGDKEKVKTNLHSVNFGGASGKVGFDSEGDRTGTSYELYIVSNGNFVLA